MTSVSPSRCRDNQGLGLVSIMLVILVLSLASITVMSVIAPSLATRQRVITEEKGKALRRGVVRYQSDKGSWPADLAGLLSAAAGDPACDVDMTASPPKLKEWCGPYLEPLFAASGSGFEAEYRKDGWGTDFDYNSTSGALKSCGPNRTCGTGGDDIEFQ